MAGVCDDECSWTESDDAPLQAYRVRARRHRNRCAADDRSWFDDRYVCRRGAVISLTDSNDNFAWSTRVDDCAKLAARDGVDQRDAEARIDEKGAVDAYDDRNADEIDERLRLCVTGRNEVALNLPDNTATAATGSGWSLGACRSRTAWSGRTGRTSCTKAWTSRPRRSRTSVFTSLADCTTYTVATAAECMRHFLPFVKKFNSLRLRERRR